MFFPEADQRRGRRLRWMLAMALAVAGTEVFLREYYGFCDAVLMREDPNYEYIAQAGQDRWRFRHRIRYNSLSMRAEEPDSTSVVILGCGDSVINGGVLTDQDSLATTILSSRLTEEWGRKAQFLNISAGSWGPDNCLAYLEHTHLPRSRAIVLFASSHDAHDNMSFKKVVGVRRHFPSEQYASAIVELVDRYLLPRIWKQPADAAMELGIDKGDERFNPGFAGLKDFAQKAGIPLIIYLHAERSEIEAGGYNEQGQEIIDFARENGIHLIQELQHGASPQALRDNIHPNDHGQRMIAKIVLADMQDHREAYGRP